MMKRKYEPLAMKIKFTNTAKTQFTEMSEEDVDDDDEDPLIPIWSNGNVTLNVYYSQTEEGQIYFAMRSLFGE